MHKCEDAAGKIYYSDKLTPECVRTSELNRHGVPLERKAAKTTSSRQLAALDKEKLSPAQSAAHQRRDKALMATYTSEKEIDLARDRNLEMPLQAARTVEARHGKSEKELQDLTKQADGYVSRKKPVPAHISEDITRKQSSLTALETELAQKNAQVDAIRAKFDADKQRFRELHALSPR